MVTQGIANPQVIALLDEALAVLDNVDSPLRARLRGRLAMEYRYAPFPERRRNQPRGLEIARRLAASAAGHSAQRGRLTDASRATLAFALNARHYALLQPDTLDQRLAISIELAQLAQDSGDWELALHSLPWRLADLLDLGHVRAADETVTAAATQSNNYIVRFTSGTLASTGPCAR